MSRHGYSDYCDDTSAIGLWRGQVKSAIRGKRGQAFLRELVDSLDAMTEKRLIAGELRQDGEVCAIGAVGARRGVNLEALCVEDYDGIADMFGIAHQLVQEIEYINDVCLGGSATPEERWSRIRAWAENNIKAV